MRPRPISLRSALVLVTLGAALGLGLAPLIAGGALATIVADRQSDVRAGVPTLAALVGIPASELRDVVERYSADRAALARRYDAPYSPQRRERFRAFYRTWQEQLAAIDFDRLGQEGRIDYVLLANRIRYELALLDREERQFAEMASLVPFATAIAELQEARRRFETPDPKATAGRLDSIRQQVEQARRTAESLRPTGDGAHIRVIAARAAAATEEVRQTLGQWYRFYSGYDPLFTWWCSDPHRRLDEALRGLTRLLRERVLGTREGQEGAILADPIGAEGIRVDLAAEMIAYPIRDLIRIAEREFAWCEAEMRRAARELGFGDDWKAALEAVKQRHEDPGRQPDLIRDLAREAGEWVEQRQLVTVPPLAKEIWRMEMMSPERQRVSPFFTGGEVITVSFPTDGMSHEEKLMSMRGNNRHFSRATVHHELIPGHHLQGFMTARYNSHRRAFSTPFWTEGWPLYWELLLWDLGFPRTPEDRIGMLFWRMHRCARIIFSLRVHMGQMTPQEAIDFLVERVGHERANAEGEVRRSFGGAYPPLYQAAYMLGGLQFRALHRELVQSGRMTNRDFHDAILQGGNMPVEMVRARLTGMPLRRDHTPTWRFAD